MMKKLFTLTLFISLFSATLPANAQYVQNTFDTDYMDCSKVASHKARGFSDAMFLGMFYGCMAERGYDVESFT